MFDCVSAEGIGMFLSDVHHYLDTPCHYLSIAENLISHPKTLGMHIGHSRKVFLRSEAHDPETLPPVMDGKCLWCLYTGSVHRPPRKSPRDAPRLESGLLHENKENRVIRCCFGHFTRNKYQAISGQRQREPYVFS